LRVRIPGNLAIFFAALLLLSQWAAAQTAPQLTPFSADVDYTSTHGGKTSHEMSGKMYVSRQYMRSEMEAGPGGKGINITNFATKTSYVLMPDQHMYMEFKANDAMAHRRGMGPNIKPLLDPRNPCAYEQVNGRSCDHWRITHKDGSVSDSWIDQRLHFPIKTVTEGSSWQLTNIKEGEPAASLFQIPPGYQKMDMGQMMQGMRPPQE